MMRPVEASTRRRRLATPAYSGVSTKSNVSKITRGKGGHCNGLSCILQAVAVPAMFTK